MPAASIWSGLVRLHSRRRLRLSTPLQSQCPDPETGRPGENHRRITKLSHVERSAISLGQFDADPRGDFQSTDLAFHSRPHAASVHLHPGGDRLIPTAARWHACRLSLRQYMQSHASVKMRADHATSWVGTGCPSLILAAMPCGAPERITARTKELPVLPAAALDTQLRQARGSPIAFLAYTCIIM